jgi:ribonuclease M5
MIKTKISAIIVVEGVTDVAFLTSFIDAEFVSTNGSDVPLQTISYLEMQSKTKPIIVLTDPDTPGQRIRAKLDENIKNLRHCFIAKKDAVKNGKVGVAETDKTVILKALEHQLENKPYSESLLREIDLYSLGLSGAPKSQELRMKIADHFHIGFVNGKQFLKRAKSLNLSYQIIEEAIREIH